MKIEVIEIEEGEDYIQRLVIDGVADEHSHVMNETIYIESEKTFEILNKFSSDELATLFYHIYYTVNEDWCEFPLKILISTASKVFGHFDENEKPSIDIYPEINFLSWKKQYSALDLSNTYKEICSTIADVEFYTSSVFEHDDYFGINVPINDIHKSVSENIEYAITTLKKVHLFAIEILNSQGHIEGMTTVFEFPYEVKTTCIQYLMYFGQFLEDLGIQADTSLREKANRVLFTVTPQDKNQALNVIYEALSAFLNAPEEKVNNFDNQSEIAIYQWKANIHHLQSQLELAKALLQAKDATIETLKLSNYQLQTIVSSKNQLTNIANHESKSEKILGGIVSIKQYEGKGFSIDLAEIFRRLKRQLR